MEGYFSRADATLKAVQAIVDGDPLMPNNLQCKLLVEMLQEARDAVIERFPDMLTRPDSTISSPNGGLLVREFYRIVKHVESLIVKSAEKPWFVAAIVIGDCKEEFRLRISEIARLIAIVQEKEDPDRRRWLERIDEIVKSKECDWKERISSAALTDEATFRVTRLPSSTRNSEFSKGSPEDHAARYLLQDDADEHKIGLGAIEEDTEKDESGSWKDKFFRVSESDLKVVAGPIAGEECKAMWMGKEFALKRTYPDWWRWARIHSTCAHPNIVRFIGLVPKETNASYSPSFLEEWMDLDLGALLRWSHSFKETISKFRRPPFDIFGALDIMLQIAQAMKYLHDRDVVHLGLMRPDNILLNVLSGASIPVQESIVFAKVSHFMYSEKINSYPKRSFGKQDDVYHYGRMCVKLLIGEDVTYSTRRSIDSCLPPLQKLMQSCLNRTSGLTFNNICVDLIHLKSVLMIDGNMQALDAIEADEFAPGLRSERIEPDHQNQVDKTEANGHRILLIILLILCMGLWLGAIKCWTLPIFSFLMNVISVSIGLYLLDFQEPVIWKYRTWRSLKVVMGLKKTMEGANFLRESIPGLAPCNYFVDVGRYETNVRTFMARSSPISKYQNPLHQQKISHVPLHSGGPPLHVSFDIGLARVSVVELGFDNVHFTSKVEGRKIEDFVVAMDLERLGTILAILHRWELSPGIGVIENLIYRPGGIYCHCLGLQSIVEGVCESINHFSDFYLPISKTFYVGCIPENQRGLYRNHVVTMLVALVISTVSTYFQLVKDYPILAIVLTVVLLVFVLGANVLDIFGGLALPILWYLILYVLCCGVQRRSSFYLWLKKCGSSMAFCDDFKPVIHFENPGTIQMMTLPFCSLRDLSIPSGGPPLDWPAINVYLDQPLGQRIRRIVLANNLEVEYLQAYCEMRSFRLKVGDRQVEAISNYVGHNGRLQTQLRLDARGMVHTYGWAEDSYFLFVYLMLKWSTRNYGVIKTVQRFCFRDFYHVFGTHELARHIANHNLVDYNIVTMRLDHTTLVL